MAKPNPNAEARRKILRELIDGPRFNGNQAQFSLAAKKSPTQVNGMLNGSKSFGETVARSICEALRLPSNYFESENHVPAAPIAGTIQPRVAHPDSRIQQVIELMEKTDDGGKMLCLGAVLGALASHGAPSRKKVS